MNKRIVIICLLLIANYSFSQKKNTEYKLKNVEGIAIGGESQSLSLIKLKAINNAKISALKKAGVEESINSYTSYLRSEVNNKMEEIFTSDILSDINGTVKDIEIVDTKKEFTKEGQIKFTVKINCTVIKYNAKHDLTFDAWVNNIKNVYHVGEGLQFTVKPTLDCYVRAFVFSNDSYVLLPNDYEKSFLLKANNTYTFPNPNLIESYELTIDSKSANKETNRIVIVLLKKDIYYTGTINYKDIIDWIMSIPPNNRRIKSFSFEVYK